MATYAVGDIHGCFETFQALLRRIRFDPVRDDIWLVGDLVNRGPDSLAVLRWIHGHRDRVSMVLGNHDLHLLGRFHGVRRARAGDTLEETLRAPDAEGLLDWLRFRPLLVSSNSGVLVHAGILPVWGVDTARRLARKAEREFRAEPARMLAKPRKVSSGPQFDYGSESPATPGILRILTQLRCCRSPSEPVLDYTGPPREAPAGCLPWFSFPPFRRIRRTLFFGHWAQLGYHRNGPAVCLDSGCVYGGSLTAFRLEDGNVVQESSRDGSVENE